jgi:hypothetical protein
MIDINLNAVPDWERSRRNTEPEVSDVSRAEALDAAERAEADDGSNGVEIDEEDKEQQRRAGLQQEQARHGDQEQDGDDARSDSVDPTELEGDSVRYDEEGEPIDRAKRGRIVDTDA